MTKPVDLDALDKAHAEWHDDAGQRHLRDVVKYHSGRMYGVSLEFHDQARRTVDKAGECLAAMHNTYPAMAAEIRALREVAEAAREVAEYHGVHGTETIQDVNVDALRAAIAKVPR